MCVAFSIFHNTYALMAHISTWNTLAWGLRLECMTLLSLIYTSQNQWLFGLGPVCVPDQAPDNIWFEPVLPLGFVREPGHDWLVVRISCYHSVSPHLLAWVYAPCSDCIAWPKFVDWGFHCWLHIRLDPGLGLPFSHHMKRRKSQKDLYLSC